MEEKLLTGVAYHGNRILRHVEEDMRDIVNHGMNLVEHMFSFNDWERHLGVMKDIVDMSRQMGLEVWIGNWGAGGPPGDHSCFLADHPEAHQIYSDGSMDARNPCYNSEALVSFNQRWLEAVKGFGGDHIFWDEPQLHSKTAEDGTVTAFTCHCETCKKLFAERYNKPMPTTLTPEVMEFRKWSMVNYFDRVTSYAASLGLQNSVCAIPWFLDDVKDIATLPHVDDFGLDPYWFPKSRRHHEQPYPYVYQNTEKIVGMANEYGKKTHIWIQGYEIPEGFEEDILLATDAAYDAGARTLLTWSYRGGEPNTYHSDHCEKVWYMIGEATRRIRDRHYDAIRAEKRKELGL